MIFYIALDADGRRQLRGTQADARAVNKQFEQIDIPTDKAGLMAFVQSLYSEIDTPDEHGQCDDCRQVLPGPAPAAVSVPVPAREPAYSDWSIKLEDEWDKLPLPHKLHFASLAMEEARSQLQ